MTAPARYIDPSERAQLLAQLNNSRDRLLFILGLNTGFRITELLSLRWHQLWHRGKPVETVSVVRARLKGGRSRARHAIRSRHVALNAVAAAAVREHAFANAGSNEPNPAGWVFASRKGGAITRRQALHVLVTAAESAGLSEGISTHSLRRTFGREVYSHSGNDLLLTQAALGHRSVLSTQTYLRRHEDEAQRIIHALALTPTAQAQSNASFPRHSRLS
ncbi:MAG: tyrosine-type recombinase/integrase [Candidatus Didemnitutus sp.]|nr:tyrosine-type recombinase/integrase [Candidatus Didemnitutus sp.]